MGVEYTLLFIDHPHLSIALEPAKCGMPNAEFGIANTPETHFIQPTRTGESWEEPFPLSITILPSNYLDPMNHYFL